MKKNISLFLVFVMAISLLTGCGVKMDFVVTENGDATADATVYFTELEKAQLIEQGLFNESDILGPVEMDGVMYYYITEQADAADMEAGIIINEEKFYADSSIVSLGEELEDIEKMIGFEILTVKMPKPIVKTNGKLSDDKLTASWDKAALAKNTELYAYTTENPTENPISIKTGKGKYVKAKKQYAIDTKDTITCCQVGDAFVTPELDAYVNGIKITGKKISFEKTGTYKFTIWTETNKKSFTVKVDGTAPTVKGVKNNKTYKKNVTIKFSDKHSGVNKATLNGKKIKSGKTVKKNGSYKLVVTDKVGNTKTVKFKIKK